MVVIRLARGGAKKRPFYHVVVTDRRNPRDGRYLERLGYYNPVARGKEIPLHLERERIQYWISVGAQPSTRVDTLIHQFDSVPSTSHEVVVAKAPKRQASKKAEAPVVSEPAKDEQAAAE